MADELYDFHVRVHKPEDGTDDQYSIGLCSAAEALSFKHEERRLSREEQAAALQTMNVLMAALKHQGYERVVN